MNKKVSYNRRYNFNGPKGLIGVALVLMLGGYKLSSMKPINDAVLEADLRMHLSENQSFARDEDSKRNDVDHYRRMIDPSESVKINSIRVSSSLLSLSNKDDVVVEVNYSVPGKDKQVAYFRYLRYLGGAWRYEHRSSRFSFYSNLLS